MRWGRWIWASAATATSRCATSASMAYAVLVAASRRLGDAVVPGPYARPSGPEVDVRPVAVEERPPLAALSESSRTACEPRG